jgi:hypothetical protein
MKAFPTTKPLDSWGDPNAGMDLRDYFAAKAMQKLYGETLEKDAEVAKMSYEMADAMMKARSV